MSRPAKSPVFRDATFLAQPHRLGRPSRGERMPGATVPPLASASAAIAPAPVPGFAEGFEAGRAAGLRQALADAEPAIADAVRTARLEAERAVAARSDAAIAAFERRAERLEHLASGFESAVARRLAVLEDDAVALAFAAVCRLVGEHAGDAETVAGFVRAGMRELRGGTLVTVRLRPEDLVALQASESGRRLVAQFPQVRWLADVAVGEGGCILDADAGSLDARLETQIAALRALWAGTDAAPAEGGVA